MVNGTKLKDALTVGKPVMENERERTWVRKRKAAVVVLLNHGCISDDSVSATRLNLKQR